MENKNFTGIKKTKKSLNSTSGSLEKIVFSSFKKLKSDHSPLIKKFTHKEDLRLLLLRSIKPKDVPWAILQIKAFKLFNSAQLLIHQKGSPVGENYIYHHPNCSKTKPIGTHQFNHLFKKFSKSKNKVFGQTLDLKDDLDIVGHFMAETIDLKNYSLIYIISKNSFFPSSTEEQILFAALADYLRPLLLKILEQEKKDLRKELIKKSLEYFLS